MFPTLGKQERTIAAKHESNTIGTVTKRGAIDTGFEKMILLNEDKNGRPT